MKFSSKKMISVGHTDAPADRSAQRPVVVRSSGVNKKMAPYTFPLRYFGVNASYPKPKQHWNAGNSLNTRQAIDPVTVKGDGGDFVVNDLHPPFRRVHYSHGRLEDSGLQGNWNTLRHGSILSYDRRPELSTSQKITLEE